MDARSTNAGERLDAHAMTATLPVYVGTLFLSAFLLFGIQPMFAKMVLPRLGGSPAVWSVAMVFFQSMLLAGYAYAHWLVSRFSLRRAALIHIALMIAVLLGALPIGIASGFERPPQHGEIGWLMALFAASVGLPFFAVAANGPLLQAWFSRTGHKHAGDPYFLYAASNVGSFLALLVYPVALEPMLTLSAQASSWAWGFGLLLAGIAACAGLAFGRGGTGDALAQPAPPPPVIAARRKVVWAALAFVPSGLLVAVTAHISTDVAAAPLLWIVPLALFLLTFVIVFQRKPVLRHGWLLHAQLVMAALLLLDLFVLNLGWAYELALHLGLFFATAMVVHGELARRRPDAANLTEFYLWMSFGGVLGGLFSGLLAPVIFNSIPEYQLLLIAGFLCRPGFTSLNLSTWQRLCLSGLAAALFCGLVVKEALRTDSVRSFFGVILVTDTKDGRFRLLMHGTTIHGAQRLRNDDGTPVSGRPEPLTYYFTGGGIADGIASVRAARGGRLDQVAAIGVGTGSLACQITPGESWSFYEIDPHMVRVAMDPARFGFFEACAPSPRFVIGDARLTLADAADASLDLIVLDAFSSDAVPVHLLTSEAIALYLRKLKPDGVVLAHISNRAIELASVVTATARAHGLSTWIRAPRAPELDLNQMKSSTNVAIIARRAQDVGPLAGGDFVLQSQPTATRPWSDDYADIIGAIWRQVTR